MAEANMGIARAIFIREEKVQVSIGQIYASIQQTLLHYRHKQNIMQTTNQIIANNASAPTK
jgi:hypothetical protein